MVGLEGADGNYADGCKEKQEDLDLTLEKDVEEIPERRLGSFRCVHFFPLQARVMTGPATDRGRIGRSLGMM